MRASVAFFVKPRDPRPCRSVGTCDGSHMSGGGILLRRVSRHSRRNRLNGYGCKNHIRRFLRGRRDAGKTTPLYWTRRRPPDLSHTLHPNAAPIFYSENVFLRSHGFREPTRRNDTRTNPTTVNDGVARDSVILFRRRVATQLGCCLEARVSRPSMRPTRRGNSRENEPFFKNRHQHLWRHGRLCVV